MNYDAVREFIKGFVKEKNPELLPEWENCLYSSDAGDFLQKHYPLPDGVSWGTTAIAETPHLLRKHYG